MLLALVVCTTLDPCVLSRDLLSTLPHGGTVWSILETLDPYATTNRIDVAGIESATFGLWGVRGSSWTQNLVRLDGLDLTDASGGRPLWYPDVEDVETLSLETLGRGASAASPGAELRLVSRRAPGSFAGAAGFRYTGGSLQAENSDNVEPRALDQFPSARLEAGGRGVYGAISGFHLETELPRFDAPLRSNFLSATGKLVKGRLSLLGIAQTLDHDHFGAAPGFAPEATLPAEEAFRVATVRWTESSWDAGFGWAQASLDAPYSGVTPPLVDLATREVRGAPLRFGETHRDRLSARLGVARDAGRHHLKGGLELSRARVQEKESVPGDAQRLLVDGSPHAVALFAPSEERDTAVTRFAVHAEDSISVKTKARFSPGIRLDVSRSTDVHWASVGGGASFEWAAGASTRLQGSYFHYPHALTSRWASPGDLSSVWRMWSDANGDALVTPNEIGGPLRRTGRAYTSFGDDVPRPSTDEVTVGYERRFGFGRLFLGGYHRRDRNLLETLNVGIAPQSYRTQTVPDVGPDGSPGTPDDSVLTVYDQVAQLGEDRFLFEASGLSSYSQGMDLLLAIEKPRWSLMLSGRAYRDVGSTSTGNAVTDNDTGVVGSLFDDPNTLTNAEGRLFFERAFTGKLIVTAKAPRSLELAAVVRYWDGQPFTRQVYFPDLGQGFTIVQAFPRGRLRYTFNMTLDVRVARDFELGRARLGLVFDAFNLANQALETEENARSGSDFRKPTGVQPARTLRLGATLWF